MLITKQQVSHSRLDVYRIMNYSASGALFEPDHPIFNHSHDGKTTNKGLWGVRCEQVFSKEECQMIIAAAEERGFEKALINVGGGKQALVNDTRSSQRVMVDDLRLASEIFSRIRDALPKTFEGHLKTRLGLV